MMGDEGGDAHSPLPGSLSVSVGEVESLLDRATHSRRPTEVVIAPVELHRRNLKLRLSAANHPLDAFEFTGPVDVASQLVETGDSGSRALDRVDRLALLSEVLDTECEATACFRMVLGGDPGTNATVVDQACTEIETVSNYHPTRVDAFRHVAASSSSPMAVDAADILSGTLAVERALRARTAKPTSESGLLRRATRVLAATDGSAWCEAYPAIERVSVVGLSSLPAPLVDLLTVIATTCDVDVNVYLRRGSGPLLRRRIHDVVAIEAPGTVVFE